LSQNVMARDEISPARNSETQNVTAGVWREFLRFQLSRCAYLSPQGLHLRY
jgi:hypothetical protein